MAGICLRGKPGWGDLGASFTTVLNTFGGTWWSAKPDGTPDKAQVNQPAFKTALDFYAGLVQAAGEKDAANSSFNECLAQYQAGKVAMWYDATVAAGLLEAANSPVKGKNGFAFAPTEKTKSSGWLWSWALAIPKSSPDPTDAWKYISWATSAQYIKAAGTHTKGGWASIPPGTRLSTYRIPQYQKAAKAFAATTLAAMKAAPINNPGTHQATGSTRRAIRRHPAVPGRRQSLHAALLERHCRLVEGHRRAVAVSGHRVERDQVTPDGSRRRHADGDRRRRVGSVTRSPRRGVGGFRFYRRSSS